MRVALIGAGRMGSAMGGRVAAAGHDLTVFNRTRSRAEDVAQAYRGAGGRHCTRGGGVSPRSVWSPLPTTPR